MPNVLKSLLIGIGFKVDEKAMENVSSGIDQVASKATKLGALFAGAFGIKKFTSDFAAANDMLGKFAQTYDVSANAVMAMGNALTSEGGSLPGFMSQLEGLIRKRDRLRVGDAGFIANAAKAGFDPNVLLNAKNGIDAYLAIADQMQKLDGRGRRLVADALGLDPASIRLLSQGRREVERMLTYYEQIRPINKEMTDNAARLNNATHNLDQNVGGYTDIIKNGLTGALADDIEALNKFLERMREPATSEFDKLVKRYDLGAQFGNDYILASLLMKPEEKRKFLNTYYGFDAKKDQMNGSIMGLLHPASQFLREHVPSKDNNYLMPKMPDHTLQPGGFGAPLVLHIENSMDGKVFEEKIIDVTEAQNRRAIDDLSNSEAH